MLRNPVLRRALTGVAVVVAAVVLLSVAAVVTVVRRPLPDVSGSVEVPGLAGEVEVLRDEQGVPHVYADTAPDLFYAQGYVHAQDRFFEMDYRRHVTSGRLAELLGDSEDAIAADVVVRTMGWRRVAQEELRLLRPETRRYLQAYADGVNAYLAGRSPAELSVAYTVLGTTVDLPRIERWTPVDSLAWLKAMAWDLRSNYGDELGRALAFGAVQDVARVDQLYPPYPYDRHAPIAQLDELDSAPPTGPPASALAGPMRADGAAPSPADAAVQEVWEAASRALEAVPAVLGRGEGLGSNSWVVAGEHTASGAPLLANDPHLAPSQPGTWYQVGLHCREASASCPFDVSGFSFAGFPGVVIGHNADIAWGFTNLAPDVTDFYLERTAGDSYLRDGQQVPLEVREEVIEVAGGVDRTIEVRSTVHGPLLSDAVDTLAAVGRQAPAGEAAPPRGPGYAVSLSWTALTPGRTADAVFALDAATDWRSFREALRLFEAPAQNVVYADRTGRIGYQAPGRIPVRGPGDGRWPVPVDGSWPLPGWSSAFDWTGQVPYDELPSVLDPEEGFLVAANQAAVPPGYPYRLTSDWDTGWRAQRIRTVLQESIEAGEPLDVADMQALQMDERNPLAEVLVPALLGVDLDQPGIDEAFVEQARVLLRDWDGSQPADSAPAAYFNAVWMRLLESAFGDELATPPVEPTGGGRWMEAVRQLLEDPTNPWWDDRTTPGVVESSTEVLRQALVQARLELTSDLGKDPERWQWGRLHRLELRQQPLGRAGAVPGPVRQLLNLGPRDVGGGSSVVRATSWDAGSGSFEVTAVPTARMVVDLGDLDASRWVNLSGNSAHPWSGHYDDQLDEWDEGALFAWPFSRDAVEEVAEDELVLRPGGTQARRGRRAAPLPRPGPRRWWRTSRTSSPPAGSG